MTDVEIMIKALRLAWIPRLLTPEMRNWKAIPDFNLSKTGGLNLLLRCNYDVKYIDGLPLFYKDILTFFSELKNLYSYDGTQDFVLFFFFFFFFFFFIYIYIYIYILFKVTHLQQITLVTNYKLQ